MKNLKKKFIKNILKKIIMNEQILVAVAVIDMSVGGLSIYDLPDGLSSEEAEDILIKKGHKMSCCSWGYFDGKIEDNRND